MNDAKFLGICILLAAIIVSGTIVWSTTAIHAELETLALKDAAMPASTAPEAVATVKIDGPVTLAPFAAPMPVTITNSDDNPVVVKDSSVKKWTR